LPTSTASQIRLALILLAAALAACARGGARSAEDLDGPALQQALQAGKALTIIDVREPEEFGRGHITGARNVPLAQIKARQHDVPKNVEVVVVCQRGYRSATAKSLLTDQGYPRVRNLIGGMRGWPAPVAK
jgi:rhodanese-related sulfurtransferase